jgi:hypothetical protein
MSLAIDVDKVKAVLLADGWHDVKDASFSLDSYEYLWYGDGDDRRDPMILLGGGDEPLIPARGFTFTTTDDDLLSGPLTSILAVRTIR